MQVFAVRLDYLTVTFWSERGGGFLPQLLADSLAVQWRPERDLFGMHGIAHFLIPEGQGSLSLFLLGDGSGRLHLRASGAVTESALSSVRSLDAGFDAGVVTRYDVAVDGTLTDVSFEVLAADLDEVARRRSAFNGRPCVTSVAGDWLGGVTGRTLYVGAPSSELRCRFYEKGVQLGDVGSGWVRFEWQVRPPGVLLLRDISMQPPTERYAELLFVVTGMRTVSESLRRSERDSVNGGLPWLHRLVVAMLSKADAETREQFFSRLAATRW